MDKHNIDFSNLSDKMKKKQAYRLSEVSGRIRKIAFDVVRFMDADGLDRLWKVEKIGGEDYIVAMFEDEGVEKEGVEKKASSNPWKTIENGQGLDVFYKGAAVGRIELQSLGFNQEDVVLAAEWIPEKLASDEGFVRSFVSSLSESEKTALQHVAPELVRN